MASRSTACLWVSAIGFSGGRGDGHAALPPSGATSNLRNLTSTDATLCIATGFYSAGDGGGGLFAWDEFNAVDDGGLRINPYISLSQPGGYGSNQPGWRRLWTDQSLVGGEKVNARWFGAKGIGERHDDTVPIQRALSALYADWVTGFLTVPNYGDGLGLRRTLYLPSGEYTVSSPLEIFEYTRIEGERGTALVGKNPLKPILRAAGSFNEFISLTFIHGLHAIIFYGAKENGDLIGAGPAQTNSTILIRDCTFRRQLAPSICQDLQVVDQQRISTAHLIVENFEFQGRVLFFGLFDFSVFRGGRVTVDFAYVEDDSSLVTMGVFNSGGVLVIEDMLGVPRTSDPEQARQAAWIAGNGIVQLRRCRFGGESGLTGIRISRSVSFGGVQLPFGEASKISLQDSVMASVANLNWLEIYDRFPALIDVQGEIPYSAWSDRPDLTTAFYGTLGVWVDAATIDISDVVLRPKESLTISFKGNHAIRAQRFRLSHNPSSLGGVDLSAHLRAFCSTDSVSSCLVYTEPLPQTNLWGFVRRPHLYEISSTVPATVSGMAWGSDDRSTGYSIRALQAVSEDAYLVQPLNDVAWGTGLERGEYVMSAYLKSTFAGTIRLGILDEERRECSRRFIAYGESSCFHRIFFQFYKIDEGGIFFYLGISDAPLGGQIYLGMFAIHHGLHPAPYTFPSERSGVALVSNITQPRARGEYFLSSKPTSGSYQVGDIVYNTSIKPSNPTYAWICTNPSGPVFVSVDTRAGRTRPRLNLSEGYQFFDTSIGKPIWFNGSYWVDSSGRRI